MKIKTRIGRLVLLILVLVLTLSFSSCRSNNPDPDDPIVKPDNPINESDVLNITESGNYTIDSKYVQINVSAPNVTLTSGIVSYININSGNVILDNVTAARVVVDSSVTLTINENSSITKVEVDGTNNYIDLSNSIQELLVIETASNTNVNLNNSNIDIVGLASRTTFTGKGNILTVVTTDHNYYVSNLAVDYIAYEYPHYVSSSSGRSTIRSEKPTIYEYIPTETPTHIHKYSFDPLTGYLYCSYDNNIINSPYIVFLDENNEILLENIYLLSSSILPMGVTYDSSTNTLTYVNDTEVRNVVILTNTGILNVDAPLDSIKHYGCLNELSITNVNTSYIEYGTISVQATLINGDLYVADNGYINMIDTINATNNSLIAVDGYVNKVVASNDNPIVVTSGTGYVFNNSGEPYGTVSIQDLTISTVNELLIFKDYVNNGLWNSNCTATLNNDLDLSGIAWLPIGYSEHPFVGTFNGNGHTITGITNAGYGINIDDNELINEFILGGVTYGFFGIIGGAPIVDEIPNYVIIKDLFLKDIDINLPKASSIGGLFGAEVNSMHWMKETGANIDIINVSVSGNIKSDNSDYIAIGGIGGSNCNTGRTNIINCINYTNIMIENINIEKPNYVNHSNNITVAGLIGISTKMEPGDAIVLISGCANYGNFDIKSDGLIYAAGLIVKQESLVFIKDSTTQGTAILENIVDKEEVNNYGVYYSVLGRYLNENIRLAPEGFNTIEFEGTEYYMYLDEFNNPKMFMSVSGCSISDNPNYATFNTTIIEGELIEIFDSTTEGLDYFELYLEGDLRYVPIC